MNNIYILCELRKIFSSVHWRKKIESFEKKVETSQKESVGMHAALKQQLEGLKDLNQQMSKEAINLTKALKGDSKSQGDWGEIQLEIILEKAGLSNGIHFTSQGGYRDENENLKKPDFIINGKLSKLIKDKRGNKFTETPIKITT